ncbi:MAG TPA: RagB/SusD family nutrient uptake outer membrane protein [Candidatus Sphingobacterium stercoripullorum]|nr:RagB/SusD family nutrient uptake outer membrane protein [Candidatus Sphingobacterium stercoripullorum]
MTIKNLKYTFIAVLSGFLLTFTACKKDYLETNPTDDVSGETIFETTEGAFVALEGTYRAMYLSLTNHGNFGQKSADLTADLMGEDMIVHKDGYGWFTGEYKYTARSSPAPDSRSDRTWYQYYRLINNANRIIDQIDEAQGSDEDKNNIRGQALAIRANSYYYLVNFFQHSYKGNESAPGVPLYTEPTSEGHDRSTVQAVYDQIISDLEEAETLLEGAARKHKSHINKQTVQGIRARVALIMEDWPTAEKYANLARQGVSLMSNDTYIKDGFNTISNGEWIWGLEVNVEQATVFASFYSHMDASVGYAQLGTQKKITKALYEQMGENDIRRENFLSPDAEGLSQDLPPYNQVKFVLRTPGNWDSDYLLMRAAEMYLIEAEAIARQGKSGANDLLDELVQIRDDEYSAQGLTGDSLLEEILLQRRIELWGEGVSLFDIKRLGKGLNRATGDGNHSGSDLVPGNPALNLDAGTLTLEPGSSKFLFRIPQDEINANKALSSADQNPA